MIFQVYSVFDMFSEEFGPVFCQKNHGVAQRSFKKMLEQNECKETEFRLYHLGSFDTDSGVLSSHQKEEVNPNGSV